MSAMSTAMSNGTIYRFENIGPIDRAELELGDLTVIAGRNNTGKTYLVYALYGFLTGWPHAGPFGRPASRISVIPRYSSPVFDRVVESVKKHGEASIPMDRETLIDERRTIMRRICSVFADIGFDDVFNAPEADFSKTSLDIELASPDPESDLSKEFGTQQTGTAVVIRYDGKTIDAILDTGLRPLRNESTKLRVLLTRAYISFLFSEFPVKPFLLTSERYGISLFFRDIDRNRSDIIDAMQKARRNGKANVAGILDFVDSASSRYFLPVHDNIRFTRDIPRLGRRKSSRRGRALSGDIGKMMKGNYRVSDDDILFVTESSDEDEVAIPLYMTSSSVRELSDFYFFVRHAADRYDLLIVDEPESHLDTANQIRMARLLARAVNAGLKVLITTHSDYIIKEINNLIMIHNLNDSTRKKAARKHKYTSSDRIDPARIRAYVAENNSLTRCNIDQYGLEMPVFDDTIDNINRVANDLVSRIAVEADD